MHCLLAHFKDGPEYFKRGTAQVFIPWMRFLLQSLVSRCFLVHQRYSFLFFFHLHLFDGVRFQYSHILVGFLFSVHSDSLIWQFYFFRYLSLPTFFFIRIAHLFMPNSIPISRLYILFVCIRVSTTFFHFLQRV